jgi:hypothetical protein
MQASSVSRCNRYRDGSRASHATFLTARLDRLQQHGILAKITALIHDTVRDGGSMVSLGKVTDD